VTARLLIGLLALAFAPSAAFAQAAATSLGTTDEKTKADDALAEGDELTMEDLVRQIEDMIDQRSLLRRNIRTMKAQLLQEKEKLVGLDAKVVEAQTALAAAEAAVATPVPAAPAPAAPAPAAPAPAAPAPAGPAPAAADPNATVIEARATRDAAITARDEQRAKIEQKETEIELDEAALRKRDQQIEKAKKDLAEFERSLRVELAESRSVRCMTAVCWGDGGTQYAVEPVVDLPIGIAFAVGGGSLTSYLNANKLSIEFNAGLRFWFWHDRLSVMIFFSKPVLETGDRIRLEGSEFEHPTSSVHRPYPNIGFGFFGDLLQVGIAYDVLVNGDARSDRDPSYRPNQVLSQALIITIGFSTVLTARTAIAEASDDDDDEQ
jgi:hypothetical protein